MALLADVLLHVARDGLDIGCGVSRVRSVNNLVAAEEREGIAVPCEGIDGREDGLEVGGVVGYAGSVPVD